MNDPDPEAGAVVVVDFRSADERPADHARLRETVAGQLRRERDEEPEHLRFLVVDTPAGLTGHATAYERVMGYPTLGSVRVVCLAVGDLPQGREDHRLRLASVLRSAGAGVLWAADPCGGDGRGGEPGGRREGAALHVLTDLLRTPEVFDRVFAGLRRCPASTAAPAVRVLEHDLSPAARAHAWDAALARFTGEAVAADAPDLRPGDLPGRLAELADGGPRSAADRFRVPGGAADAAHGACGQALRDADRARSALARPSGLYDGRPAAGRLARAVEEAARALGRYRDLVAGVLRDSGGLGIPAGQAGQVLAEAGITLPPEGRERPGSAEDDLGRYTLSMLGEGLDLHAVAGRLTALSERLAPLPAGGRLPELAERCPPGPARSVTTGHPFRFAGPGPGPLVPVAVLAFAAALWPWPGTLLCLLPLTLLLTGHLLAARARPNRAAGGPMSSAWPAQSAAAVLGATGGLALGAAVDVPPWAALAGLLLSVPGTLVLLSRRWARAVDAWWAATGADRIAAGLDGVDALLADAVRQQWWAVEERTRCADGARSLAGALRTAAGGPAGPDGQGEADDWDGGEGEGDWLDEPGWTASAPTVDPAPGPAGETGAYGAESAPGWLDPGTGEGGPELLDTLVADLADATADALRRHWDMDGPHGFAGPADAHAATPEQAVRQAVDAAHRHLSRNGVVAVPPFAQRERRRGDPVSLLGVGPQRLREALAPELLARRLQPLCSPAQLALLSRDPAATWLIRFAPEAVRPPVADGGPHDGTEGVVWTASGRFVGAVRLTPLRAGTVEAVWARADDDPDDDGGGPHGA
ncbi:hypothetical protein [Streptomyces cinnamoneus]|uniref:Uncharacterized protein n=1 Tax=Streptomyces cinnamoneus TaxID=53446 RepID=A0A918WIB6_STRCJ|nr:hypothetical protein [Streptomyces cinnamoneus]GHC48937.1 hypothetical protein GCM10010507_25730 [Streptomyces cinnamoneus]